MLETQAVANDGRAPADSRALLFTRLRPAVGGLHRIGLAASALYQGVWLGLLDRRSIHAVGTAYYSRERHPLDNDATPYSDASYNVSGLRAWEERAVRAYFANCRSIIVAGAGGGRETIALARDGYRVTAFDCTARLVELCDSLAARDGLPVRALEAPPDEVPDCGLHDGAIVGWGAYTHIMGAQTRIAFLRTLRAQIRPGGPLLVSVLERGSDNGRYHSLIAGVASIVRRLRSSREPVEPGDQLMDWYQHRFTREELERELRAAGFRPEFYCSEAYAHAVAFAN